MSWEREEESQVTPDISWIVLGSGRWNKGENGENLAAGGKIGSLR